MRRHKIETAFETYLRDREEEDRSTKPPPETQLRVKEKDGVANIIEQQRLAEKRWWFWESKK
jgi:hypothetical protein